MFIISVPHEDQVPTETKRRLQTPGLELQIVAIMWVLGTRLRSFAGAAGALQTLNSLSDFLLKWPPALFALFP